MREYFIYVAVKCDSIRGFRSQKKCSVQKKRHTVETLYQMKLDHRKCTTISLKLSESFEM